jgi:hypothetical protein
MDDNFEIPIAYRYECQETFKEGFDINSRINFSKEEKERAKSLLEKWKAVLDGPPTPLSAARVLYTPEPFESKITFEPKIKTP